MIVQYQCPNSTTISAGRGKEMTKSFSTSAGVFCLHWKENNQRQSVWSNNFEKLLEIFFQSKDKEMELIYFPPVGKELKVFGRLE